MIFQGKDIYDGLSKEITVSDGYIKSIKIIDTNFENFLSHSFIDMQVNGYLGVDYSGDDLSEEGILTLIDNLAKTGTMRHVPTIITNSEERIEKNLKIISKLVNNKKLFSMILYGKPGIGKTSIATAIVNELGQKYILLNAVINNKQDFDSAIFTAKENDATNVLFVCVYLTSGSLVNLPINITLLSIVLPPS